MSEIVSKNTADGMKIFLNYIGSIDPNRTGMDEALKHCRNIVEGNFSIVSQKDYSYKHFDHNKNGQTYWINGFNRIYIGTEQENGGYGWLYSASVQYIDASSNKNFSLMSFNSFNGKQSGYKIDDIERNELVQAIVDHAKVEPTKDTIKQLVSSDANVYSLLSDNLKRDKDIIGAVFDKMFDDAEKSYRDIIDEYNFSPTGGPDYIPKDAATLYFETLHSRADKIGIASVFSEAEIEKLSCTHMKNNGYESAVEDFIKNKQVIAKDLAVENPLPHKHRGMCR